MAQHALPQRFRDLRVVIGLVALGIVGAVVGGIVLNGADAQEAEVPTVSCPDVASQLPTLPAGAAADVNRELAGLERQIAEANARLASSQGEGGPNFANNAVLGPLEDKRFATLERIAIAIGRFGDRPAGLESLAACALNGAGEVPADPGGGGEDTGDTGDNGDAGDGGEPAEPGDDGDDAAAPGAAPTVSCPDVAGQLAAVPAAAAGDVDRELAGLERQIAEANARLASSQGEGGPNFVNNAVLGPLEDKRFATLERIEIAIGRQGERPTGLTDLAACTLSDAG
jgi:hypothetical protein